MSARSAVAQQQGADEETLDAVDQYEQSDFTAEQKAALRLADAYLTSPADMSDSVKREVAEHLSSAQVVELAVKLMGFSSDKAMVALGLDFDEVRVFTM
jgi:alkylhydroperoxidase family enzyme